VSAISHQLSALAHDLNDLDDKMYTPLEQHTIELKRMLTSFIKTLKADS
jgi:hypothetical protein